jgi:tRNA dimethylallyltransferase
VQGNLVVIVGPTAVGKTNLCVRLAEKLDAEVFSADSRQLYREMSIGTAKPSAEEMKNVPHHFVNSHSIEDSFSAGDYERALDRLLPAYFARKEYGLLSGGTGLFVQAALHGLDAMPEAPAALRAELMTRLEKEGLEALQKELLRLDPHSGQSISLSNPQRVVRALEVCLSTGKPFSSFKTKSEKTLPYNLIKIGIERNREELYRRINLRVDLMLEAGLLEEVKTLLPYREKYALQTVGYKEVFSYLDGECSREETVELIKRNSRRYAKRQMTWFKNQDHFQWFNAEDEVEILAYIKEKSLPH